MKTTVGKACVGDNIRVYAIGDVHGCLDELKEMLKLIKKHLKNNPIKHHRIIFLGDYVDRGADSKGVVKKLMKLANANDNVACLIGNHDEKLLLATKELGQSAFTKYLNYGGSETLMSYGIPKAKIRKFQSRPHSEKSAAAFADLVKQHIPKNHLAFFQAMPASMTVGDYFFCHAGVCPKTAIKKQSRHDLMWIREPFLSWSKPFSKVIIHGHTRQKNVDIQSNRINIDTSCVYGGELTAIVLENKNYDFLTVPAKRSY